MIATPALTRPAPVSPAPDHTALTAAARLILNAAWEAVIAQTSPEPPPVNALATAVTLQEVLKHFLSDDERQILRAVAAAPAGRRLTGAAVQAQTSLTKNNFWCCWSQLQVRGLVTMTGASRTASYQLGCEWLRMLLA